MLKMITKSIIVSLINLRKHQKSHTRISPLLFLPHLRNFVVDSKYIWFVPAEPQTTFMLQKLQALFSTQ